MTQATQTPAPIDEALIEGLGHAVRAELDERDAKLRAEFDAKINALASRDGEPMSKLAAAGNGAKSMRWMGVWEQVAKYGPGHVTTFANALWLAQRDVSGIKPGGGSDAWRMILKAPGHRPARVEPEPEE